MPAAPHWRPGAALLLLLLAGCAPSALSHEASSGPASEGLQPCDEGGQHHPHCLCDRHSDCAQKPGGQCVASYEGFGYDPGVSQRCSYPECSSHADCAGGRCLPAGQHTRLSTCVEASCFDDGDCLRAGEPPGVCTLMGSAPHLRLASRCVFPEDPCAPARPCAPAPPNVHGYRAPQVCAFLDGRAQCVVHEPIP